MNKIYTYTDYRKFVKDYYLSKKKSIRRFSYRSFSEKAGFSSPNFIKLVIDGKKNLGKESVSKLCKAMELRKKEAEYFSYLVFFNQAKTTIEKNYYFGLLASIRTPKNVQTLDFRQYEFFNNWYNTVVREIIKGKKVDSVDPSAVARMILPNITPGQVKKSIKLLKELDLIKIENGTYIQSSPLIQTEPELQSLAVRNYHKKMIVLSGSAVEDIPRDKRNISCITGKISEKGYERIKKRIAEFREELMQILSEDDNVDQVYQINFQVFPLTKKGI